MVKVKFFDINNVVRYLKVLGSGVFAFFVTSPFWVISRWTMNQEVYAVAGITGILGIGTYVLAHGWSLKKFWKWK